MAEEISINDIVLTRDFFGDALLSLISQDMIFTNKDAVASIKERRVVRVEIRVEGIEVSTRTFVSRLETAFQHSIEKGISEGVAAKLQGPLLKIREMLMRVDQKIEDALEQEGLLSPEEG